MTASRSSLRTGFRAAIVAAAFGVCASGASAEGRIVSRGEGLAVSNETAATATENLSIMYGSLGLDKPGEGVCTLPRGQIYSPDPIAVRALTGEVSVSSEGSVPQPAEPTAALNLASFWLDASVNQQTNEAGEVTWWYDRREAKTGENAWSNVYTRAKTFLTPTKDDKSTYTPVMPKVTTPEGTSLPMVNFGGYKTGTCMVFCDTNSVDTNSFSAIRHVYMVANFQHAYGFPFGAYQKVLVHPTNYGTVSLNSYYNSADSNPSVQAGEFLVNGARCNPISTTVRKGLQLIEMHALADIPLSSFMRIFGDRGIAGRYGGDFIGEVLVFDGVKAALTDAERLAVSRYLMAKWGIAPDEGTTTVCLGEGTIVRTAGAPVDASGRGTMARTGTETAHYRPTAANPAEGVKVHLPTGAMKADARELNLAVTSGEALSFARDKYGVHTVTAGSAAAGDAAVSGAREVVRLGRVDASVTNLSVSATRVVLGDAVLGGTRLTDGVGAATIANGSFESGFSAADWVWDVHYANSTIMTFNSETAVCDWRIAGGEPDCTKFKQTYRLARFMPTDGKNALFLKQQNVLHGHVTVARDGDYVLAFDATGRYKYDNMQLILSLVDAAEQTNTFACCTIAMGTGYHPYRYLLSGLKAGAYKLVIKAENGKAYAATTDSHAMLDNFHLTPVTDGLAAVGGVSVPNGTFENTHITSNTRVVTDVKTNDLDCVGWTLTSPDAPTDNAVVPVSRLMGNYYDAGEHDIGTWQLRFHGTTGRATSAPFSLPAGRWVLRCKAAKYAFDTVKWNEKVGRNPYPVLAAKITVNGEQVLDATTSSLSSYDMKTVAFKGELVVAATDQIVIELRETVENGFVNVDDLEFVPAGTWGSTAELVKNGSFSSGLMTNWNWDKNGAYWLKTLNGGFEEHYGGQRCDDAYAVCINNNAGFWQDINFPAAGTYRLSFWARSRVAYYDANDKTNNPSTTDFGGNALRASLIVGGVTNTIVETPSIVSTNFNQTVALFTVPTAGTHRLAIAGVNDPKGGVWTGGSKADSNVFLDLVSVTAAPEGGAAPTLPADLSLKLTSDTQLRLDYVGEATVHKLKIGTKRYHGRVDASVAPGVVTGPGVLNVTEPRPGMAVIVK